MRLTRSRGLWAGSGESRSTRPPCDNVGVMQSNPLAPSTRFYRFAGVELDRAQYSVRVDGQPRTCSRKAFEFLVALCRAGDRVISRSELNAELWPGGQIVSDEALTQVIFRGRAVLGPYGPLIITVRGVGLRLDAEVVGSDVAEMRTDAPAASPPADEATTQGEDSQAEPEPSNVTEAATPPVEATSSGRPHESEPAELQSEPDRTPSPEPVTAERPRRAPGRRLPGWLFPAIALALTIFVAAWLLRSGHDATPEVAPAESALVNEGFGLQAEDLLAASPDTASMVREALRDEERGERDRGMDLLRAVHDVDPQTPIPALFLALWSGGRGNREDASRWLGEARTRLSPHRALYPRLLLAYIEAELEGPSERIVSTAGAVLNLRPKAWRFRHARGHLLEFMGMRAAALHELQQIEVPALGVNQRDMALGDRASLGDLEGAQAVLDRLPTDVEPLSHAYLRGRLAWTRGDFDAALEHFQTAAAQSYDKARADFHGRSLKCMVMLQVMFGRDAEAIATAEQARKAEGGRSRIDDIDLSLLLAELHEEAGRTAAADEALERAIASADDASKPSIQVAARFAALRLRPQWPRETPPDLEPDAAALWQALSAFVDGDADAARSALSQARQAGIGLDRLADEARWLELQLGLTVSEANLIDPPLPPISRVVLRRAIRRSLESRGVDPGLLRP